MIDPYQPPQPVDVTETPHSDATPEPLGTIARRVFGEWEKLRLVYVGWLVVLTLVANSLDPGVFWRFTYWFNVISGAILANLAFFAGPALETYVRWLGVKLEWLGWTVFLAGTLFATVLALATIMSLLDLIPNQA